ncbi:hypothetical protein TNCV_2042981 [Trichonephila clavipes]|nr:hypothetical protein TNCV_2042981 [Trichonephila clavipes]
MEINEIIPDKQLLGCRWVYNLKRDENGKVIRYKARLAAQGCSQTLQQIDDKVSMDCQFICLGNAPITWQTFKEKSVFKMSWKKVFKTAEEAVEYQFSEELESEMIALPPKVHGLADEGFDDTETLDPSIVRVQYFVRGGFVGYRSRASSKHLSPHLPVDELDSSGVKKGLQVWVSGPQRSRLDVDVLEK